jgi:hypothetical protein
MATAFASKNSIYHVANPRKVFNLAAVCALHLLFSDTKSASPTQCKQPLRQPEKVGITTLPHAQQK